jgi:uncharacterized protein
VPAAGAGTELLRRAPALAGKAAVDGKATAYLCREGACGAPVQEPAALREALSKG